MERNEIECSLKEKMDILYKYYSKKLRYRWILALTGLVLVWFLLMYVPKTGFVNPLSTNFIILSFFLITFMFFVSLIFDIIGSKKTIKSKIDELEEKDIRPHWYDKDYIMSYCFIGMLLGIQFTTEPIGAVSLLIGAILGAIFFSCIDWIISRIVFKNIRYDMGFTESLFSVPIYKLDLRLSEPNDDLFKLYIPNSFSVEETKYVVSKKAKEIFDSRLESFRKEFNKKKECMEKHMSFTSLTEEELKKYADFETIN